MFASGLTSTAVPSKALLLFPQQVTFAKVSEGVLASSEDGVEGCEVSRVEKSTLVKGERTLTLQGDPSLSTDLPSAQDDFRQVRH